MHRKAKTLNFVPVNKHNFKVCTKHVYIHNDLLLYCLNLLAASKKVVIVSKLFYLRETIPARKVVAVRNPLLTLVAVSNEVYREDLH